MSKTVKKAIEPAPKKTTKKVTVDEVILPKKVTVKAVSKEKLPEKEKPIAEVYIEGTPIETTVWIPADPAIAEANQKKGEKIQKAEELIAYIATQVATGAEISINRVTADVTKLNQK